MLNHRHVNYDIADGDIKFDCVQMKENNFMIQLDYRDVVAEDVSVELEQAVSAQEKFDVVPSSTKTLDPDEVSCSWNITGLAKGVFIRVALRKGTATAGVINTINYLY